MAPAINKWPWYWDGFVKSGLIFWCRTSSSLSMHVLVVLTLKELWRVNIFLKFFMSNEGKVQGNLCWSESSGEGNILVGGRYTFYLNNQHSAASKFLSLDQDSEFFLSKWCSHIFLLSPQVHYFSCRMICGNESGKQITSRGISSIELELSHASPWFLSPPFKTVRHFPQLRDSPNLNIQWFNLRRNAADNFCWDIKEQRTNDASTIYT